MFEKTHFYFQLNMSKSKVSGNMKKIIADFMAKNDALVGRVPTFHILQTSEY
jgi:hypothetical protein